MSTFFTNSEYLYSDPYNHMAQTNFYEMQQQQPHNYTIHSPNESELDYNLYRQVQYANTNSEPAPPIHERSLYVPREAPFIPRPSQQSHTAQSDILSFQEPPVLSWPMGGFVPFIDTKVASNNSLSSADILTPDLMLTASSGGSLDEASNVFEMQFGAAMDTSNYAPEPVQHYHHTHGPIRSPRRTPSPPSNIGSYPDPRRRFPCHLPGCSRRFTSQYTLKVHMEAHKPKPKNFFPCTHGCNERFSRQHDRLRHEVAKHGKVCEFSCEECGRFFSTAKTLGNHKCPMLRTRWVHN